MEWSYTIEKDGTVVHHQEGLLSQLPQPNLFFLQMARQIQHEKLEPARVSASVARALPYGEVKINFTVTVNCPQDERWMNKAAEHAFLTAVKYVNEGLSTIAPGTPLFHAPEPKP